MIIAYTNDIGWFEGTNTGGSASLSSLITVVLLILCELGPIFQSLDYSFGNIIKLENAGKSPGGAAEGYEPLDDADYEVLVGGDDGSEGGSLGATSNNTNRGSTRGGGGGRRGSNGSVGSGGRVRGGIESV